MNGVVQASPKIFGRFEVLELLGRGGCATVYKARDISSSQIVALKIGPSFLELDEDGLARFHREFTVIHVLEHPHLVRALEMGDHHGVPYIVMEYVAGQNLEQRLLERGCLAPEEATRIFVQAAEGLRYLHENHVLHRDIKPSNIFLGERDHAKLGDFGLLKRLTDEEALTRSHQGMGTMEYGAPEQFEDAKHADRGCDLYSLAASLYTALTGKFPFGIGGHLHILQRKLQNQFVPLRLLVDTLDPAVDQLVSRCLHPNPQERPKSSDDFLAILRKSRPRPAKNTEFDGPSVKPRTAAERRASIRFEVDLTATFVPFHQKMRGRWDATILDVSQQGVCLQTPREIAVNSVLQLTLGKSNRSALALVRWVRPAKGQTQIVGCAFVRPLPRGEFDSLYRTNRRTRVEAKPA